jgi:hypothetical protein
VTSDLEVRVKTANPVDRLEQLELLFGDDASSRLLRESIHRRVVRMYESEPTELQHTEDLGEAGARAALAPTQANRSRGWLVAAAMIVAAVLLVVGVVAANSSGGTEVAAPPVDTTERTQAPTASPSTTVALDAAAVVSSALDAFNVGDIEGWLAHFSADAVIAGIRRSEAAARYAPLFAANVRRQTVAPCRLGEPDREGRATVSCSLLETNDFYAAGGLSRDVVATYAIADDGRIEFATVVDADGNEADYYTLTRYATLFWDWLERVHPDVFAAIDPSLELRGDDAAGGSRFPETPEAMSQVLEYVDDFVAQSDTYPVAAS